MKKRLLITSIVMMLVVAVALSTATYAWFTQNAAVTASTVTLKAGVNEADALGIGWLNGDAGTAINANISGTLLPMAPSSLSGSTKTGATEGNVTFSTKTTKQENSVIVFNTGSIDSATPITYGNGSVSAFYVKNLSPANTVSSITVSAVFTGNGTTYAFATGAYVSTEGTYFTRSGDIYIPADPSESDYNATLTDSTSDTYYVATNVDNASLSANDMIRVAIFKKANSTGTSNVDGYTLLGVLGQTATQYKQVTENDSEHLANNESYDRNKTYYTKSGDDYTQVSIDAFASGTTYYTATNTAVYGTITPGTAVKTLYNYEVSTSLQLTTNLAAGDQVDIVALVWLDGAMLTDSRQNEVGNVSLFFQAA